MLEDCIFACWYPHALRTKKFAQAAHFLRPRCVLGRTHSTSAGRTTSVLQHFLFLTRVRLRWLWGANDQQGQPGCVENPFGDAAHDPLGQAAPPMSGQCDEIAGARLFKNILLLVACRHTHKGFGGIQAAPHDSGAV